MSRESYLHPISSPALSCDLILDHVFPFYDQFGKLAMDGDGSVAMKEKR